MVSERPWWRSPAFLTLLVLALGLALRLLLLEREDLWYDEAISITQARQDLAGLVRATAADNYPPLHNLLLHFWIEFFGVSAFATRMLSVTFSVLAIWMAGRVAKLVFDERGGERAGLIAMLLMAVAWFQIKHGQETRMYALFAFLALWSSERLVLWLRAPSTRTLCAYVATTTLLAYCHYFAIFFIACQSMAVFVLWLGSRKPPLLPWVLGQLVVVVLFLPWLSPMLGRVGAVQGDFWIERPTPGSLVKSFKFVWHMAAPLVLLFILIAVQPRLPRLKRAPAWLREPFSEPAQTRLVLFLPFAGSFALAFVLSYVMQPIYLERYLIAATTVATVLCAGGIARVTRGDQQALLVALLVAVSVPELFVYYHAPREPLWRAAAAEVQRDGGSSDMLLVWPPSNSVCLDSDFVGPLPPLIELPHRHLLWSHDDIIEALEPTRQARSVWFFRERHFSEPATKLHDMLAHERPLLSQNGYASMTLEHFGPRYRER